MNLEVENIILSQREYDICSNNTIAVHIHVFYIDVLSIIADFLNNIPQKIDLFISSPNTTNTKDEDILYILKRVNNANNIILEKTPNIGRDIAPILCTFGNRLKEYDFILHLHTKKTKEDPILKGWLNHILEHLLPSKQGVREILYLLNNGTGMIAPPDYSSCWDEIGWSSNMEIAQEIVDKSNHKINIAKDYPAISFPQGSMFWGRTDFLKDFFELPLTYNDFPKEPIPRDGTIAHALERLFFLWGANTSMKVAKLFLSTEELKMWKHMKEMIVSVNNIEPIENLRKKKNRYLRIMKILAVITLISVIANIVLVTTIF